jgi:60 kDa SS-A/Ro ribonucleoprotein
MRFNSKANGTKTENLAGGEAFAQSPKLELASILLTSFVQDQFYRSANDTVDRVKELITGMKDKSFAAKAAIYARTKFGMRSISHVVAREIARVQKEEWTKKFFEKIVYRPDDMLEILALYLQDNGKRVLPNSMRKGFAKVLERLDEYKLAKYKKDSAAVKMVDVVNLVHPHSTKAIDALIKGTLKPANTWETKLTQAGQLAEDDNEKDDLKEKAWGALIKEGKLPYFALLRNLRNIIDQADDETFELALTQLVDEKAIKKSLVLPFRFLTAIDEIEKLSGTKARKTIKALDDAVDIACANVPAFDGNTAVVLDKSGSMNGKPLHIGSLFAAVLAKASNADILLFADSAHYWNYNPKDSVTTIAQKLRDDRFGGGTDLKPIFTTLNQKYDRIIILSDEQGWVGYQTPTAVFAQYKKTHNANPHVFTFDLQGYGTLQFPENQVYCLAGFSDKVFQVMKMLEQDRQALVHEIEKIQL